MNFFLNKLLFESFLCLRGNFIHSLNEDFLLLDLVLFDRAQVDFECPLLGVFKNEILDFGVRFVRHAYLLILIFNIWIN